MVKHPIRVTVTDDLDRNRWTVFFRLILAIPLFIWLVLWGLAAYLAALFNWFATLIEGRSPEPVHEFLANYVRYATHVHAYVLFAANPYPGFTGEAGYPVDVQIDRPARQNRWKTGFRIVLALPALILTGALVGGSSTAWDMKRSAAYNFGDNLRAASSGVAFVVAVLAWFAILARGRMPRGFRDLVAVCLRYGAQSLAYVFILTDRYPDGDPALPESVEPALPNPVRLTLDDAPRRSRLTVFFRLPLAVPHLVWLTLWGIAALFAEIAMWLVTLIRGRPPAALHRFLSAYVRYTVHVEAFLFLIGGPFPGFNGQAGSYPVDLELPPPGPQRRWGVFFRLVLAVPALIVGSPLGGVLYLCALFSWFASLITARQPLGLQRLAAFALRYSAQTNAYVLLVTDRYPYSGPATRVADEQLALAE